MRESFIKKSSNAFFEGRKAKVLNDIHNIGHEIIKAGSIVEIIGKHCRQKTYLDIKQGKIEINGVAPENLELVKESENDWPIENDTLNLREHEFNIIK
jgi:hypothetical protein